MKTSTANTASSAPKSSGEQPGDPLLAKLSDPQRRAIESLTANSNVTECALAAGVSRSTVHRWLNNSAPFRAAYNAWRQELAESARARLLALADRAVTNVANTLETGDTRTAITLLKGLGLLNGAPAPTIHPAPSTDPKIAEQQLNLAKRREEQEMSSENQKQLMRETFGALCE